jgi:hypothetical protein
VAKGVPRSGGGRGGSDPDRWAALCPAVSCGWRLWTGATLGTGIGQAGVADRWGSNHCNGRRGQTPFESIQIKRFNSIQIFSNFDRSEQHFPVLKKIEIKYGFECLEETNNFLHRNVFRFEMDFELKIWEFNV